MATEAGFPDRDAFRDRIALGLGTDTPCPSAEIRAAIAAGDVGRAAAILGRPHFVDGLVVRGDQRGRLPPPPPQEAHLPLRRGPHRPDDRGPRRGPSRPVLTESPMPPAEDAIRVLVVDDEVAIRELVGTALRYEGFAVELAATGREALAAIAAFRPALVVLDVMLPDHDGLEVLRRLRRDGEGVPVVFLTARDDTQDKVSALASGGDDYVTKPFSLDELVARVQAVLRRAGGSAGEGEQSERLTYADLELDEATHEVWRAGVPVTLTATEFRMLRYFLRNPRRVLSKAQLLEHVWDYDFGGEGNNVETYVSYLRKKLDPLGPPLLHTVRGAGYALRLPAP